MGTRSLEIVRHNGRYYVHCHHWDGNYEGVGSDIVANIPADPNEYQAWLKSRRSYYDDEERRLETELFSSNTVPGRRINPDSIEYFMLPTQLPRFCLFGIEYWYIINLDREILTMDFGVHWKLNSIPRKGGLWLQAISESVVGNWPTICSQVCPEEHMASPALALPEPDPNVGYESLTVTARADASQLWQVFLVRSAAEMLISHNYEILGLGREWQPGSLPFRELAFAILSATSGNMQLQRPDEIFAHTCRKPNCAGNGKTYPLPFGSSFHLPGKEPGASPAETMYWFDDVLVSLTLVPDGAAVTKAASWGFEHGRTNFQLIVMSMFHVILAEVSSPVHDGGGAPCLAVSKTLDLSPMQPKDCWNTHPLERPSVDSGEETRAPKDLILAVDMGTAPNLRRRFPGLAALVHFFDAAASRRVTIKSGLYYPTEIWCRILDFVDHNTWKACLLVSPILRKECLRKFRVDATTRLLGGPFVKLKDIGEDTYELMSYDFECTTSGRTFRVFQDWTPPRGDSSLDPIRGRRHRLPIISRGARRVVMADVPMSFIET